jgi:tetratricopeptide (TPR) repeat protein
MATLGFTYVSCCSCAFADGSEKLDAWIRLFDNGDDAHAKGDFIKADHWYRLALDEARTMNDPNKVIRALGQVIRNDLSYKPLSESETYFQQAMAALDESKRGSAYDNETKVFMEDIAENYYGQAERISDPAQKELLLKHYIKVKLVTASQFEPRFVGRLATLATYYLMNGRYEEALPFFYSGLAYNEKFIPDNLPARLIGFQQVANVEFACRHYDKARSRYLESVAFARKTGQFDQKSVVALEQRMAAIDLEQHNFSVAHDEFMKALNDGQKIFGSKNEQAAYCLFLLGLSAQKQANNTEAERMFEAALDGFENAYGKLPKDQYQAGRIVITSEFLANCLSKEHNMPKARELEQRAKTLRSQYPDWAKVSNRDTEIFFVVWDFLPFAIELAPSR